VLSYTKLGRHAVAVGSNELTARLCGVPVSRVRLTIYALGGLLAGLAGILEFSTLTVGDPTDSVGLELEAIAAVVIGGGSLSGGQGSVAGTLIGALLLTVIKAGCTHMGMPNWIQEILTGAIIIIAMTLDRIRQASRD
jgi:ribose transport system permease protein